jgi:hypothetical protein
MIAFAITKKSSIQAGAQLCHKKKINFLKEEKNREISTQYKSVETYVICVICAKYKSRK